MSYPAKFHYKGETARRYLERRTHSSKWHREQHIIDKLVASLPRGSSILDVPLGTGRFLPCYDKCNQIAYGIDISLDMLSQARSLQPAMSNLNGLIQGDAESIPLRNEAVDYVICMRLLNWTPMPILSDIISEFRRIARKGIIIEVRVSEPIGLLRMIQKTAADPWTCSHRLGHAVNMWTMRNLKRISRRFDKAGSTVKQDKSPDADDADGYILHNVEDLTRILAAHSLVVRHVIEVDKGINYRKRHFQPLLVMFVAKGLA